MDVPKMNISGLRERVEELIASVEVDEAIRLLLGTVTGFPQFSSFRDDVILLLARHARLSREQRNGVIATQDAVIQLQQLRSSTLDLLRDMERRSSSVPTFREMPRVTAAVPSEANLEKIIGAVSHLKSVAWLARGVEAARSVCRIVTREGLGTGFMIQRGVVLTNHHVLPSPEAARQSRAEFNFQETLAGSLDITYSYEIDDSTWAGDARYDCAMVRLKPSDKPVEQWGVVSLERDAVPAINTHVSIIQHPNGGPKQIAVTANQVINVFQHRLQYTTDTLPGSSGSPVFNDDWKVVALHHAGGQMKTNPRGDTRYVNEGILITHLDKFISGFLRS